MLLRWLLQITEGNVQSPQVKLHGDASMDKFPHNVEKDAEPAPKRSKYTKLFEKESCIIP